MSNSVEGTNKDRNDVVNDKEPITVIKGEVTAMLFWPSWNTTHRNSMESEVVDENWRIRTKTV